MRLSKQPAELEWAVFIGGEQWMIARWISRILVAGELQEKRR
jgi:hypothetical protein